tara:strand:- start:123 stop:374 length:252 start_codon:yes stop_codon:yes gene_type:complete
MQGNNDLSHLKGHFIEEITLALRESESKQGHDIDYVKLNDKILYSWKSAHTKGVDLNTFVDWISDAIPEHIGNLDIVKIKNAA